MRSFYTFTNSTKPFCNLKPNDANHSNTLDLMDVQKINMNWFSSFDVTGLYKRRSYNRCMIPNGNINENFLMKHILYYARKFTLIMYLELR